MPSNPNDVMNAVQIVDRLGFKIVGALARIFGSEAAKDEESFFYSLAPAGFVDLTAVAGNSVQGQIEITQEADFVATRATVATVNPVSGVPFAEGASSFTTVIRDGSTDRQLTNVPAHNNAIFGDAYRSNPLTKNRLFRRNSSIFFTFTQLQAVATRIFLTVWGYKVFDQASLDLTGRRS